MAIQSNWRALTRFIGLVAGIALTVSSGCSSLTFKIQGVPACDLPPQCRALSKSSLIPIDFTKLAQRPPDVFRLGPGDILGVSVEGIVPLRAVDGNPIAAPVHFPEAGNNLPPAIGVPVVVQASGSIHLLGLEPIFVWGLSLEEAAVWIREAYLARNIIGPNEPVYPVVTLIRARTVNVMVIREDTATTSRLDNTREAVGGQVQLSAYKNDVLSALMATGGLPGLRARNDIRIYRNGPARMPLVDGGLTDSGLTGAGLVEGVVILGPYDESLMPSHLAWGEAGMEGPDIVIPLRVPLGMPLDIPPRDVLLHEGDVVYIANRDTEVFYTGGLLPGGEHLLPRDYDIDVFEAMAIAGYSYGQSQSAGRGMIPSTGVVPTQLFIFRQRADGTQSIIEVDLEKAVAIDCERLLIKPGDKLLLRHSPQEETLNFGIFAFFTYGLRQLFR